MLCYYDLWYFIAYTQITSDSSWVHVKTKEHVHMNKKICGAEKNNLGGGGWCGTRKQFNLAHLCVHVWSIVGPVAYSLYKCIIVMTWSRTVVFQAWIPNICKPVFIILQFPSMKLGKIKHSLPYYTGWRGTHHLCRQLALLFDTFLVGILRLKEGKDCQLTWLDLVLKQNDNKNKVY